MDFFFFVFIFLLSVVTLLRLASSSVSSESFASLFFRFSLRNAASRSDASDRAASFFPALFLRRPDTALFPKDASPDLRSARRDCRSAVSSTASGSSSSLSEEEESSSEEDEEGREEESSSLSSC